MKKISILLNFFLILSISCLLWEKQNKNIYKDEYSDQLVNYDMNYRKIKEIDRKEFLSKYNYMVFFEKDYSCVLYEGGRHINRIYFYCYSVKDGNLAFKLR